MEDPSIRRKEKEEGKRKWLESKGFMSFKTWCETGFRGESIEDRAATETRMGSEYYLI